MGKCICKFGVKDGYEFDFSRILVLPLEKSLNPPHMGGQKATRHDSIIAMSKLYKLEAMEYDTVDTNT